MKLIIINGENNDERIEINIDEDSIVENIKDKLGEKLHGNGKYTKYYFKLIYKNIILLTDDSIKSHKICENDEIWFGKIENYLRKDDFVIVYAYIWGPIFGGEYLIVNRNDTISAIRSIIERIHSKIINVWNADGEQMRNDQVVTDIDTDENYKLIIRCDDGDENEINNTFDKCCYLHDRDWVDYYLFIDKIRDDNKNESIRIILIDRIIKIRQIISSNDTIDDRLNQNLSDLPSSFLNSKNFFCIDIRHRILDICNDYWKSVINQYGIEVVKIVDQYFIFAIRTALRDFFNIRQQNNNKTNKSMKDIVIDALDYSLLYLNDSNNDWRYWLRLWMNQCLLRSFSDSDLNERIDKCAINKFTIKMRISGKDIDDFITFKPETIIEAKQTIANIYKVDKKHLYCIKPGGDDKPNDEDKFDDEFIIEFVMSMNNIEILKWIGQGAFSEIHLCRDKISNKQFVLKKPIQIDRDLYRDINIYSKLNSSINIMNYSGLYRYGENICIGMEYMSGGSLRSYLDKGKHLSEREVVKISFEILTQINELHKLGIIHRDIKSDNIVIDEHNHAKLIDFGLSKYTIGLSNKDLLEELKVNKPGTICYMAPELIKGNLYSKKVDIWSFGMVIVEMVTGKRPFHGLKEFQVYIRLRDNTNYEFQPIFPISNELDKFIDSCLNKISDERPSAEQLIKSELFVIFLRV